MATVPAAACGVTVSVADRVTPAKLADTATGLDVVTALVVILKAALVAPAGTVTLAGAVAGPLPVEIATTAPPAGAAVVSRTVP
jgi:hypothetical protein